MNTQNEPAVIQLNTVPQNSANWSSNKRCGKYTLLFYKIWFQCYIEENIEEKIEIDKD